MLWLILTPVLGAQTLQVSPDAFSPRLFLPFFSSPPPPPLLHCAACILVSDYSIQGYYHGSIIRFFSNWLFLDRMLEDPSYSEIVRWGDEGDSFVVLEVMRAPPPPPPRSLPLPRIGG